MDPSNYLRIAHVLFVILFLAATFVAFAQPTPERKKRMAMLTGILGFLAFVLGFGLLDMAGHASASNALRYPLWAYVKILIWIILSVLGVAVFRSPGRARTFGADDRAGADRPGDGVPAAVLRRRAGRGDFHFPRRRGHGAFGRAARWRAGGRVSGFPAPAVLRRSTTAEWT